MRNIAQISRALPGAERKRTRLNAPITATPVPMLPFTSIITICTIAGSSARVSAYPREVRCPRQKTAATAAPITSEQAVHIRSEESEMSAAESVKRSFIVVVSAVKYVMFFFLSCIKI